MDKYNEVKTTNKDIKHGEWKWTPISGMLYCSCCDNFNPAKIEFNYCPNCGAEMKRRVK
jgi:Zn finger protein HypA/HybF involved in hydrogenase expression